MSDPQSSPNDARRPTLKVSQADTKWLLAIETHLGQLIRTAMKSDRKRFLKPVEMDHGNLLLASASLRALLFDRGARPLLIRLTEDARIDVEVETVETNLGLVLLSVLVPEPGHVSDYLASAFLDPEHRASLPINEAKAVLIYHEKHAALEDVRRKPGVWSSITEGHKSGSQWGPTHFSTGEFGQILELTRRLVPLRDWGNTRIGFLKNVPISRRNIVEYVANRLGGVHYDSNRSPHDTNDLAQFRVLATAYDWDDRSLTHAGFIAVGLLCMELLQAPGIYNLYQQCTQVLAERQRVLLNRAGGA